jgi:MoaA/NifB/PqqE/SkfB family radical SAM enzyme
MSSSEKNFTSTGIKFLKYLDRLEDFQVGRVVKPITLHIMPESRCNLKCGFCSVAKRNTHERLDLNLAQSVITQLCVRGLKGVVISGGGEPTLYPYVNELLSFLFVYGLKVGLITNGTMLRNVSEENISKLSWVRISGNVLDYVGEEKILVPKFSDNTVFGMSYIVSKDTQEGSLNKVRKFADKYGAKYIRVAADCLVNDEELELENKKVGKMVDDLDDQRFFHHYKKHGTPDRCYLAYFHPILYCDGYIYPCDSLVLNDQNQDFDSSYRLCKAEDIVKRLYTNGSADYLICSKEKCKSCVWEVHNNFLCNVRDYVEHAEFV